MRFLGEKGEMLFNFVNAILSVRVAGFIITITIQAHAFIFQRPFASAAVRECFVGTTCGRVILPCDDTGEIQVRIEIFGNRMNGNRN
jgi:hypothetical protein